MPYKLALHTQRNSWTREIGKTQKISVEDCWDATPYNTSHIPGTLVRNCRPNIPEIHQFRPEPHLCQCQVHIFFLHPSQLRPFWGYQPFRVPPCIASWRSISRQHRRISLFQLRLYRRIHLQVKSDIKSEIGLWRNLEERVRKMGHSVQKLWRNMAEFHIVHIVGLENASRFFSGAPVKTCHIPVNFFMTIAKKFP